VNGNEKSRCSVSSCVYILIYWYNTDGLPAVGPVLEAFGYERIIFGTSPSLASPSLVNPADWYALVRESFAELAVEQDAIDSIFSLNARRVYGSP
jgi:predicted TIM-barrel fold metal-dependent hydrolase